MNDKAVYRTAPATPNLLISKGAKSVVQDFTGKSSKDTYGNPHQRKTFFICNECVAVFSQSGHMKRHMQTHTEQDFPKVII